MSIVLDSSAALEALIRRPVDPDLSARLRSASEVHAPHLIDVEVLNGLRRLTRGGELSVDRASDARQDLQDLAIIRYAHVPLGDRIWALRENLTAHDACYVALAEALGFPLITCDAGLAGAPGTKTAIELYPLSAHKGRPEKRRR